MCHSTSCTLYTCYCVFLLFFQKNMLFFRCFSIKKPKFPSIFFARSSNTQNFFCNFSALCNFFCIVWANFFALCAQFSQFGLSAARALLVILLFYLQKSSLSTFFTKENLTQSKQFSCKCKGLLDVQIFLRLFPVTTMPHGSKQDREKMRFLYAFVLPLSVCP